MTQPSSESDLEPDSIVEAMLAHGLPTRPLDVGGMERMRAIVGEEWRASLTFAHPRALESVAKLVEGDIHADLDSADG